MTAANPGNPSQLPKYTLAQTITNGAVYITYASATWVRLMASNSCELEYDYGVAPSLSAQPASFATAITALAGGGQTGAPVLSGIFNRITTVATANDSVILPNATPGVEIYVYNATANSANIFPQSGQSIGVVAVNTARAIAPHVGILFFCTVTGIFDAIVGNATS